VAAKGTDVAMPYLRIEETGQVYELDSEITTVGRGDSVDIAIADPSVSRLHAELVRRGDAVYVADLGLSTNGTRVNGRPVGRRVLAESDVISFGAARTRIGGLAPSNDADEADTLEMRRVAAPDLTRRELDVLAALCRPALQQAAFVAPSTARDIAAELVVTEAAVKQHLLRLYMKFRIPEGINRRTRLANEVISLGVVRPSSPTPEGRTPGPDARPATVRQAG